MGLTCDFGSPLIQIVAVCVLATEAPNVELAYVLRETLHAVHNPLSKNFAQPTSCCEA